jgi:hypothetical protein
MLGLLSVMERAYEGMLFLALHIIANGLMHTYIAIDEWNVKSTEFLDDINMFILSGTILPWIGRLIYVLPIYLKYNGKLHSLLSVGATF